MELVNRESVLFVLKMSSNRISLNPIGQRGQRRAGQRGDGGDRSASSAATMPRRPTTRPPLTSTTPHPHRPAPHRYTFLDWTYPQTTSNMSRRDKQADLRKRMVEARSKLLSSHAQSSPQQPDDGRADIQLAGQKRPAPTAASGGGILRKSKYNSSAQSQVVPQAVITKAEVADASRDRESGEVNTPASAEPPTPAALLENEAERREKKKKKKMKKKHKKADQHEQEESTQQQSQKGEDGDDMDEAFAEFNALLEADETNAMSVPQPSAPSVDETDEAKAKKKKKKKKRRKEKDVYDHDDNDAANSLAQASYEARIARLTLLAKNKQRKAGDELGDKDFYDPGLAFQQDEDTQAVAQDSPRSDEGEDSKPTNNSHSNLAKALRERIEEARKLTRSISTKEEEEQEESDVQDGSWF